MTRTGILLGLLLASTVAIPAQAQQAAFSLSGGVDHLQNPPFTLGYAFSLSEAFSASGLGFFDEGGDGLLSTHDVGLWDSGGTLLASTTLSGSSGTLIDGFRYNAISPLTLSAGSYTVGALFLSGNDGLFANAGVTPISGVTYDGGTFASGGVLANPTAPFNNTGSFFGPNLLLAAVPEPATWAMLLFGFAAIGGAMRSTKRRQNVTVSYA